MNSYDEYKGKDEINFADYELNRLINLLPEVAHFEYMIFQLCNGDITKKKEVEENFDVVDFYNWIIYKNYENCLQELSQEILIGK